MYESFFEMEHTPFTRDIPVERLYTSPQIEDALGRLVYVVDHQMFAVVMANPGCGKSTMVRMLDGRLGKEKYLLLYLSDSKLTPRWLYAGLLGQLGLEPHYFSGDSKRLLQKEIQTVSTEQKLERLSALNALLNMDEKGDDAFGMDDGPEEENGGQETSGHDVQKSAQEEKTSERPETGEKAANTPIPYPVENARHD